MVKVLRGATLPFLLVSAMLLPGCDGSGSSTSDGPTDSPTNTPADAWTLSGTFHFPANETATDLYLVVTADATKNDASAYVSDPVALTLSGTPPTADFELSIDTTWLGTITGTKIVTMQLFQDLDGDGVHDVSEAYRGVNAVMGSNIWCNVSGCSPTPAFQRLLKGTSGYSSVYGSYTIDTTGWYYNQGCDSNACAQLIIGSLTGAELSYDEYNTSAITPAP